jgi:hypothetical protein
MRIRLTESQYDLIKIIKENSEISDRITDGIDEIKKKADGLYTIITFTTIAELRDGDTDVGILEKRVETLSDMTDKLTDKVYAFEQRNMDAAGNWFNPRVEQIWHDMDLALYKLSPKINALENLVSILKPISRVDEYGEGREKDIHGPFANITPTEI